MGEDGNTGLRLHFDDHLRLQFNGAKVTTDAGLLAVRELDEALGLTVDAGERLLDSRTGRNTRHDHAGLLRQSVYARLAGYEDVNDQEALTRDPAMRAVVGRKALERNAEYLEENDILYAIRIAANQNLYAEIEHLLTRPVGRPPKKPRIFYHSFSYRAVSWMKSRRVVAKVGWHAGELFPRVGFIVTNLQRKASSVTRFYNREAAANSGGGRASSPSPGPGSPAPGSSPTR